MTDESKPLDTTGPPSAKRIGNEPQLELLTALRARDSLLGQTYEGALRAYADEQNPDRLAQAAHSMRELFDALPVVAAVRVKPTASLGDKVMAISGVWFGSITRTAAFREAGWDGAIDAPLRKLLQQLGEFFRWFREEHPGHGVEKDMALDKFDPGRGQLPEQLKRERRAVLDKLARYMNAVAHHNTPSSGAEFAEKLSEAEAFLRTYVKPAPLADRKTMDEILKGES